MSNQISCEKFLGKAIFRTNGPGAHLFGLEPHFGCCTANFGQGWPKLCLAAFMHNEDSIISAIPVPSCLRAKVGGENVEINLKTEYPFKTRFTYEISCGENTEFDFIIRIPSYAKGLTLDGQPAQPGDGQDMRVKIHGPRVIQLEYALEPVLLDRPNGLKSLRRGPLVFSVPIEYEKVMHEYTRDGVERKFPYCDYEYVGKSRWAFGLSGGEFTAAESLVTETAFSSLNPPVVIKAKLKEIDWGLEDGYDTVCAKVPESIRPVSDEVEMDLYPYGCAKLRMTELPLL